MYKRLFLCVFSLILTACGGGGALSPAAPSIPAAQGGSAKVTLSFALRTPTAHKITSIDPATLSFSVVVNALAPQIFNVTPGSGGCTASPPITCTETVNAPIGNDAFTVTAYSANNAGGVPLDAGTTTQNIANNAANSVTLKLMPVVSTAADGGAGSLRYAVAGASAGDTITFLASALPAIPLASPIVVTTNNLTISGPGAASLTISGSSTGAFEVDSGTSAIFSGIKFAGAACTSGCAFVGTGTMILTNDDFESNCASVQGGAISAGPGSAVTINNSTFNLNCVNNATASAYGGAIYSNGVLNVTGSTFTSNTATSASTTMSAAGGAIYADTASTVVLLNDTFTSNAAHQTGATSYGSNALGGAIFSASPLTVHGGTFSSNTATDLIVQYSFGGAIDSANSGLLTIDGTGASSNPVFTLNSAESGGAIEASSNNAATSTLSNVTFTHNSTLAPTYGIGGALDIETSGGWNMTGLTFSNNTASSIGGAIEYNAIGSVALSNSTFTSNSVTDSNAYNAGGAIDMELGASSPVDQVTNVSFTNNTSNGIAGAVRDDVGYADVYSNCTFTNNSSVLSGGAFYDQSGVVISGSTFSGNASTGSLSSSPAGGTGGAIFIYRVSTAIDTSTIDSNSATDAGGGIFIDPNPSYNSAASIVTSTVSNNSVTASGAGYGGGGIYINHQSVYLPQPWSVTLLNDTIYGNSALNADGGGIYNAAPASSVPPVTIDFVTMSNNSANAGSGSGGNLENNSAGTLTPSSVRRRPERLQFAGAVRPQGVRRTLAALESMVLTNSVLVNGSAFTGADLNDSSGTVGSFDFLGTAVAGGFGGAIVNASYQSAATLGPLSLNSPGTTKTLAVPAGSLLINAVPFASCDQTKDQRGNARVGPTSCTPGAYEYP